MTKVAQFALLFLLAMPALAQPRPYIGYVYPAGGQQGTSFQIRLGGQNMDDVKAVRITGTGASARIVEYCWRQNNQEQAMLVEQLQILKKKFQPPPPPKATPNSKIALTPVVMPAPVIDPVSMELMEKLQQRTGEFVQTPACASIASLVMVEVTITPDAMPGPREIRVVTVRGVSNPMPFLIGQVPEYTRVPMRTATIQILGKEVQALRKRPPEQAEDRVAIPATLNGQIASGEVNSYRFTATKGQRLLLTAQARQLVPFIADAVPGWFQPVMVLTDGNGKEVAYNDDYRFKPDPTIFYEVPKDGEYVLGIHDSLFRGREDFVYRITVGELPFVTGIFPLGGRTFDPSTIKIKGWNVERSEWIQPSAKALPGVHYVTAKRDGFVSNPLPFEISTLPEVLEAEPNNDLKHAQKVTLPMIINGRINRSGDWDVFQFAGKANQQVVAEVLARRLDSPLDSVLKLTDATGKVLAFNDDHEDIGSGANTHHADSYLMAKLPADGVYFVHISDTARNGGDEYAYRLRISVPMPDFELRAVPSSISLRSKSATSVTVYVIRKDGFSSPIRLALKDPPAGIVANPVTLAATQALVGFTVRTTLATTDEPFSLVIEGKAVVDKKEIVHEVMPAEDRMQAFLWRHLVPAQDLEAVVFDPAFVPQPKRTPPATPEQPPSPGPAAPVATTTAASSPAAATVAAAAPKPKFTAQQVAVRIRELKRLYGAGYLTDEFYLAKFAECQVSQ